MTDQDYILTNVMIYWLTRTAGSAARLYYEDYQLVEPVPPTTTLTGVAVFPNDFLSIRRFAERDHQQIIHWSEFERGGHNATQDAPNLLVGDIREFFSKVR